MKKTYLALVLLATVATPAFADGNVTNRGLIEQTVTVQHGIELMQRQTVGSIQSINLVGGNNVDNRGTIRQTVTAESLRMEQRQSLASVQAINAVVAGNPAAHAGAF